MWPLLPLIFLIALIPGCDRKEEKTPPTSANPPPPRPAEQDTFYRSSCLADLSCPQEERRAAIYDYVGAVYGEKGKVQFIEADGRQKLGPLEKHYVEEKFGRLFGSSITDPNGVSRYLSNAKDVLFNDLHFPPDSFCQQEPDLPPWTGFHPTLGQAVVLFGRHGCGAKYADQFFKSGLELSLAVEPEQWTFFLESFGTEISKKVQLEEMELFTRIAQTLKIPLENPLPDRATSLDVRKEAAKKSKYTPEDFAVAVVFQVAANASFQNPNDDPREIFRKVIDGMAPELGMESADLFNRTRDFLRKFPLLRDQQEESDRRAQILAETSNRMSQGKLSSKLRQQAQGKKTPKNLFVVGSNHVELIRSIYSTAPENNRK